MNSSKWIKEGLIFNEHKSQLPVPIIDGNKIRIFYSTRIGGKSVPMWIDLNLNNCKEIIGRSDSPILDLGKPGLFDWSGVMPTCVIKKDSVYFLYYIGWSQRIDVPYHNNLGLALSKDGGLTWEKYSDGPVLSTSYKEPGYIGTCDIIEIGDRYIMYYLSCREWIEHEGRMEPIYDVKIAESMDLINWDPLDYTALKLEGNEGGISSARVIPENDSYSMYFSVRDKIGYREDVNKSYRIKKAISKDGFNWDRVEGTELGISDNEWENFMVCYPGILETEKEILMFYNGNGFGDTGICYARKNKTT